MANPFRGEADITIGGLDRKLVFDFNALAELEEGLGKPVQAILEADNIGVSVLRQCIYVGLKANYPNLSVGQVGGWLDPRHLAHYATAIGAALEGCFGTASEKEKQSAPLELEASPAASTGLPSSSSDTISGLGSGSGE